MNPQKRNYIIYFYAYFVATLIYIYIYTYLPIYFFEVLVVDRTELAFIQFFALSVLFLKPVMGLYFDKVNPKIKIFVIISSFCLFLSFFILILSLTALIIFGFFLGILSGFSCILDVAIDKCIIQSSTNENFQNRNILFMQLGMMFGGILPNFLIILLIPNIYSISSWTPFFLIGIFLILPLVPISFILNVNIDILADEKINLEKYINKKSIYLMCIFIFLASSTKLFEYSLEPWILEKYGERNLALFALIVIIIFLATAIGIIIATRYSHKFERRKVLLTLPLITGILLFFSPFFNIIIFIITISTMQFLAGILIINMTSLMVDLSGKRVLNFQIMATFSIVAQVVYIPLGLHLSSFIATEIIIVITAVLYLLSIIPMYFILKKKD